MENLEQLHETAREVAKRLPGWSYGENKPVMDEEKLNHWAELANAECEATIYFSSTSWPQSEAGKWQIAGDYPNDWRRHATTKRISIGVSKAKDAKTIARDITRRLLPDYMGEFFRVKSVVLQSIAYDDACRVNAAELAEASGGSILTWKNDHTVNVNSGGEGVSATMDGRNDHASMKLSNMPIDFALKVCHMIKAHNEAKQKEVNAS